MRRAAPGAWPDDWRLDLPGDLGDDADEAALIAASPEPPIPSVYAPLPVETEDYPVPASLRAQI